MTTNKKEKLKENSNMENSKFLYVGIGASAGGLDALEKFLTNIPEQGGMAVIIIQHMDPSHKSSLANILSRYTDMNVLQVEDGVQVQPNNIYIIPPNKDMGILDGKLHLMEPIEPHGLRMPINYFLTSLAQDQQDRSVGIILSGYGSDGSIGLKAIKANGGIGIAQDPSTAGSDSMPVSAINTGLVDLVLAPEEMPEKLLSYTKSSKNILKKILSSEDETIKTLMKIFILIRNRTGHDFSQYKKSTINRRISRRMNIHQIDELSQYLKYLQENPQEINLLFKEFLINVTSFFRDPEAFESLKKGVLKGMIESKSDEDILRIWVPGCSSGEEVYSIGIIIKELLDETNKKLEVQLFGTDLDANSIKTARSGTYPGIISTDMSKERLNKFFYRNDNLYTIKNDVRDMVIFATHNVIKDPPFTKLDMIVCRNLLIYLEIDAQENILSKFNYALKKDGILFLGPSESIGEFIDSFSVVDKKWKIFKCIKSDSYPLDFMKTYKIPYREHSTKYLDSKLYLDDIKSEKVGINITDFAEKKLIKIFAPPSALINDLGDILYIHGRLGNYLEPYPGKAHMNILEMAREGIKLVLTTAIQNVITYNKEVVFENQKFNDKTGKPNLVKITVKPLKNHDTIRKLLIVSFEEVEISKQENQDQIKIDSLTKSSEYNNALENELKMTKERLNITIDEMTTANEELKSANEELQSMNEESQSTNEELETSKEELQSINEELTTVNNELQMKIDELVRINDDMNNLFNSTEIATIFLDNDLKIRRFTKEATKLIKLITSDVGRPLSDIVSTINYPTMIKDIEQVIEKVAFKEKEVFTTEGKWYKVKIMPYKTSKNVIDGATITFMDINKIKIIQEKMQLALNYAENIINTVKEPLIIIDQHLMVVSANKSFYDTFKLSKSETEGVKLYQLGEGDWDIPHLKNFLEDVFQKDTKMNKHKFEHNFNNVGHKKMLLNARRIYGDDNQTKLFLLSLNDLG